MAAFSMTLRATVISFAIAAAFAAPGAASDRSAYMDRLKKLKIKNPTGVAAAWRFLDCNAAAARSLAERETGIPAKLWPIEAEAMEAIGLCSAEEEELAAAVPIRELQKLKGIVQAINAQTIKRARRERTQPFVCAQAEWRGCSMKPIPEWKNFRR